jgi:hypothetical protein
MRIYRSKASQLRFQRLTRNIFLNQKEAIVFLEIVQGFSDIVVIDPCRDDRALAEPFVRLPGLRSFERNVDSQQLVGRQIYVLHATTTNMALHDISR